MFLRSLGVSTLAFGSMGAASARVPDKRSLSFEHTHTGESLSVVYFQEGTYQAPGLERINHLLRDFRTEEVHPIDRRTLDILFDLQTLADRDEPFQVISGYRSPESNARMAAASHGVAKHSLHMEGRAIDIRMHGCSCADVRDLALAAAKGGVGYYRHSDFVHIDTGRFRTWNG